MPLAGSREKPCESNLFTTTLHPTHMRMLHDPAVLSATIGEWSTVSGPTRSNLTWSSHRTS